MWQLENRTPFAAERAWVRDRDGAEVWLVAVKCTFQVHANGATEVAAEQPPVLRGPQYCGEGGGSSIRFDADLVLTKTTTDIILVGHAYAPRGRPATDVQVDLCVGQLRKSLRVFGDRRWGRLGPSAPEVFTAVPLVYERAYGGVDPKAPDPKHGWEPRNPVGTGFAAERGHLDGVALPNIELPGKLIADWDDRPPPAGFGVIASHWQPRCAFAGSYDERWLKERQPLLPDDFDERFFQCAPLDQQSAEFLQGDEPVVLRNLTPTGELRFVLPRVQLSFETRFFDGEKRVHETSNLHTVILEPDLSRVSLVWHTALPCHTKVQKLDRTVISSDSAPRFIDPDEYTDSPVG